MYVRKFKKLYQMYKVEAIMQLNLLCLFHYSQQNSNMHEFFGADNSRFLETYL